MRFIYRLMYDRKGQSMVEYGLLVALIAVALIAVIIVLRGGIQTTFQAASNELAAAP